MKFIELDLDGENSHYINIENILYVHNNKGIADIYIKTLSAPIHTRLKYEEVRKLIIDAPNF